MSDWFYTASGEELAPIQKAAADFRDYWNRFHPPFATDFTGEVTEVQALDYLDYEALGYPACGYEGAALVWGEVLRRAIDLRWVISYRGDYMLASGDDADWPRMLVWPFGRAYGDIGLCDPARKKRRNATFLDICE